MYLPCGRISRRIRSPADRQDIPADGREAENGTRSTTTPSRTPADRWTFRTTICRSETMLRKRRRIHERTTGPGAGEGSRRARDGADTGKRPGNPRTRTEEVPPRPQQAAQ